VLVAAAGELLGALTGTAVALTIGQGIVAPNVLTQGAVVAALLGAMAWSLLTYRLGIPVSETHGLIGGIVGVGLAFAGPEAVQWRSLLPVLAAIFVSPAIGILAAVLLLILIYNLVRATPRHRAEPLFLWLQRLSSIYMAFSDGRNDAQKPMGVLTLALAVYFGWATIEVPLWVILSVAAIAGLGVAAGGWRIIRTLGMRLVSARSRARSSSTGSVNSGGNWEPCPRAPAAANHDAHWRFAEDSPDLAAVQSCLHPQQVDSCQSERRKVVTAFWPDEPYYVDPGCLADEFEDLAWYWLDDRRATSSRQRRLCRPGPPKLISLERQMLSSTSWPRHGGLSDRRGRKQILRGHATFS